MKTRDLRQEIEEADEALKTARAELAAARELTAELPKERAKKTAALQAQLAALRSVFEELAHRAEELKGERRRLERHISAGRSAVSSQRTFGPLVEEPATSLDDVVRPAGWRKGQPWYSRFLWWVLGAKEWK